MSDINTLNDFGEVHWAYDKFIQAANVVIEQVGQKFIEALDQVISSTQLYSLPMLCSHQRTAMCLVNGALMQKMAQACLSGSTQSCSPVYLYELVKFVMAKMSNPDTSKT